MKKVLTVLLILAMVFSLAGFAVAEDSVDTMPQSACLDCGFSEGHDVSCPLYAAELPLPEFSDACSECGGVFGEHAESCSAYVISDDEIRTTTLSVKEYSSPLSSWAHLDLSASSL